MSITCTNGGFKMFSVKYETQLLRIYFRRTEYFGGNESNVLMVRNKKKKHHTKNEKFHKYTQ